MVKETKIVFELSDLTAIRFVCTACEGEVVHPNDSKSTNPNARKLDIPERCPSCNKPWEREYSSRQLAEKLMELLQWIPNVDNPRIAIRFEIDDPKVI